jgi:hypothetical protein
VFGISIYILEGAHKFPQKPHINFSGYWLDLQNNLGNIPVLMMLSLPISGHSASLHLFGHTLISVFKSVLCIYGMYFIEFISPEPYFMLPSMKF